MTESVEEDYEPFPFPEEPGHNLDLKKLAEAGANTYYSAIQNASNNTERSKKQADFKIGISTLGHCRQYARLMLAETPFSNEVDKTAAFFGTVAGDAIEAQLKIDHPDWLIQKSVTLTLPNGLEVPGTSDVVIPKEVGVTYEEFLETGKPMQGVWDGKSKAELDTIKKYGPNQQQIFQIHGYTKALIQEGVLDPTQPIVIMDVFFDRSGRDVIPYGVAHVYREDVIDQINEWMNDVLYAHVNGEDAPRDLPRDFCWKYCEYAETCRGSDTDTQGLIEDPEQLQLIAEYKEASAIETEMKKKKAKLAPMITAEGSTGQYNVRRIWVNEGEVSYHRPGSYKLDIRPVPKGRK